MREILFRGKTPSQEEYFDDGEWIYGFYSCFNRVEHRIYSGCAETDCGDYYPDWWNVRSDTVGQYTGLTDKNGKKIFEGDILEVVMSVGYVVYGEGCFCVQYEGQSKPAIDIVMLNADVSVIGNIHDNPELVKGAKDDA